MQHLNPGMPKHSTGGFSARGPGLDELYGRDDRKEVAARTAISGM